MTDPHDLDTWLTAQVRPLPPPPGTFELIRKRARRRKMTRAVAAAAGAAAVIAVAATVPRLVITQLGVGPGPTPNGAALGQTSPARPRHHQATASGPGTASPAATPAAPSPPVPANFAATSVTFVGPDTGFVIGQAGTPGRCTGPNPDICTSLAGTGDGGRTWHGVPAPLTGAPDGPAGVSQVRFYDTSTGWAFGPQLWATHDGGQTWQPVSTGGRRVTDLEAAGQRVFAVWARCTGHGADFAAGCTSARLYSAAPDGGSWAPVAGSGTSFGMSGAASPAALVLTSHRGYLLRPDGMLLSGPVTGPARWRLVTGAAVPCLTGAGPASSPPGAGSPGAGLLAATTSSGSGLVLVCPGTAVGTTQPKTVYTSADGGRSWQKSGPAGQAGTATSVAATGSGTVVLATTEGIQVSTDGGASWAPARGTLPAGGFGYVGMTEVSQGVAVPADPGVHAVWFTHDGGRTWQESPLH
jgi:photosystem II stability/assembly factor-like uncharacterized protein